MRSNAAFATIVDADVAVSVDAVACPKCSAVFAFRRSETPRFDAAGFESYDLKCVACDTTLAGIIDPSDDSLLLCVTPDAADTDVRHSPRDQDRSVKS